MLPTKLLTPAIADFVSSMFGYLPRKDKYPIALYSRMLRENPKAAIAAELRALFMLSLMQDYRHPDEAITDEVLRSLNGIKGSWQATKLKLLQFMPFGFSFAEKSYKVFDKKASLQEIKSLNQEYTFFECDRSGEMSRVRYAIAAKEYYIPYESGIHFINQEYLIPGYDPYGIALCDRAISYWQLHKIIMSALAIAGQRQATPLLIGKTDTASSVLLFGHDGRPLIVDGQQLTVNKGEMFKRDLAEAENSSVLVIDRLDEILAIASQTDGQFLRSVLYYLDSAMLWCFFISPVVAGTSESGLGDSSLIKGHLDVLRTVGRSQMRIFGDGLIEGLIRPMLEFNHGAMDNCGSFPVIEQDNTNTIALLNAIANAIQKGTFDNEDVAIVQRAKQLAGIAI
jgi:hypothetical protein